MVKMQVKCSGTIKTHYVDNIQCDKYTSKAVYYQIEYFFHYQFYP